MFVDTWGWLCLRDRKENKHEEVREYYQDFLKNNGIVYTSDYVLDETFTLLYRRLPQESRIKAIKVLKKAIINGFIQLQMITEERLFEAIDLKLKYADKPDISFTDITSFLLIKELGINEVLTAESHFNYIGIDLSIVPK